VDDKILMSIYHFFVLLERGCYTINTTKVPIVPNRRIYRGFYFISEMALNKGDLKKHSTYVKNRIALKD